MLPVALFLCSCPSGHRLQQEDEGLWQRSRCRAMSSLERQGKRHRLQGNRYGRKSADQRSHLSYLSIQVDEVRGSVVVNNPNSSIHEPQKVFTFDTTFGEKSKQVDVYNEVARPIVDMVLEGYNGMLLWWWLPWRLHLDLQGRSLRTDKQEPGRRSRWRDLGACLNYEELSRTRLRIFLAPSLKQKGMWGLLTDLILVNWSMLIIVFLNFRFLVRVSYLEIYNEEVRDLLGKDQNMRLEVCVWKRFAPLINEVIVVVFRSKNDRTLEFTSKICRHLSSTTQMTWITSWLWETKIVSALLQYFLSI